MAPRKITKAYYFSVEGNTERLYLERLQLKINNDSTSKFRVSFIVKVGSPQDFCKAIPMISATDEYTITHIFDRESSVTGQEGEKKRFKATIDRVKQMGKKGTRKYLIGYSNITFELWLILHKMDCNGYYPYAKGYLAVLEKAFGQKIGSLDTFKKADTLRTTLDSLSLEDVKSAIARAETIMQRHQKGKREREYNGYTYVEENPSLSVHLAIKKVLEDCSLL